MKIYLSKQLVAVIIYCVRFMLLAHREDLKGSMVADCEEVIDKLSL